MPPCATRNAPSTRTGRGTTARRRRRPGPARPDPVPVRPRGRGDGRARAPAAAADPISGRGGVRQRRAGRRRAQPDRRGVADRGGAGRAGRRAPAPAEPASAEDAGLLFFLLQQRHRVRHALGLPHDAHDNLAERLETKLANAAAPRPPNRPTTCCSGRRPSSTGWWRSGPRCPRRTAQTWDEHRARLERELVRLTGAGRTGLTLLTGSVAGLTGYAGRDGDPADPKTRAGYARQLAAGPGRSAGRRSATSRAGAVPESSTRSAACRARAADPASEVVAAGDLDVLRRDPAALVAEQGGDHHADVVGLADAAERGLGGERRGSPPGTRSNASSASRVRVGPGETALTRMPRAAELLGHVAGEHVRPPFIVA